MLAASAGKATSHGAAAEKIFRSKAGQTALIAEIAKDAGVKRKAVVIGKLRAVGGYDQGFELPPLARAARTLRARRLRRTPSKRPT